MYNPYDNNNQQNNEPENQPVNNQQSSYTWNTNSYNPYQTRPPVYNAPVLEKKKKPGFGKKVIAMAMCCVLSSAVTIGAFAAMVQTGFITVQNKNNSPLAFTISKVVDDSNIEPTSTIKTLTKQQIAEKVLPSVVCVQNYAQEKTNNFFGIQQNTSNQYVLQSEGTAVIMSDDGYMVTNAHVVDDSSLLKVILEDGSQYEAEIVGQDDVTDLAVIKIEETGLSPAEFGSSGDLKVADEVMAVGNPGGLAFSSSVTLGYVSALNRQITVGDSGYVMNVIQTDAAINPGNSGGALVNQYGQVIGINSSKFVSEGYEGLGFAIPIDDAQPIVSDLKNYGYVKDRAVLGITGGFIDQFVASYNGVSQGMMVQELTSDNAKASGLQMYDIITEIEGVSVTGSGTLASVLASKKPGDEVTLKVDRTQTKEKDIEVKIILSQYSE